MSINLNSFEEDFRAFAPHGVESEPEADRASLAALLAERRFNLAAPPPKPTPIFQLGGAVICTPGNLTVVSAQAKAGKTALLGAFIAATMDPKGDTLNVHSANPKGAALVHFDTEQSPYDHHTIIAVALRRAQCDPPTWLRSYRLADVDISTRLALLGFELEEALKAHGAIHSVILDGVADLCHDPNDAEEAFALVGDLHRTAIVYNTAVLCVLHENPGNETGKTRGHLGSQLERKAETNLRLAKDNEGATVVFTERARHAFIPRDRGCRFKWCDDAMMHVTTASAAQAKVDERLARLRELAVELFDGVPESEGLSWKDACERIQKNEAMTQSGARKKLKALSDEKVIRKTAEKYFLDDRNALTPRNVPNSTL